MFSLIKLSLVRFRDTDKPEGVSLAGKTARVMSWSFASIGVDDRTTFWIFFVLCCETRSSNTK